MKTNRNLILLGTGILLLVAAACGFSASTANITDAYTARSENGEYQQTAVFAQEDVFYAIIEVANAPDDTVAKAMWYAVEAEGVDPNYMIAEAEYTGGGEITFDLTNNDMLWPAGKYKVEIYLNDELEKTLEFSVLGTLGAAPLTEAAAEDQTDTQVDTQVEDTGSVCAIESDIKPDWSTITCDEFVDNSYGWYEGLDDSDLALVEVAVEDGKYVVDVTGKAHSGYSSGVIQWFGITGAENFVASIDGSMESKNRGVSWGFNFWGSGSNFYSFTIGKEGQYFMDVLEDGDWTRVMQLKTNKAIEWGDAVNNLTIVAEDGVLTFYVNGERIDSYQGGDPYGTEISLFINVDEGASASYYFDNALVRTSDF